MDLGFPSHLLSPGAQLTSLLKKGRSVSTGLDPRLSGHDGCAVNALTHLAFAAPGQSARPGEPGCALPPPGTRRPYRGRGGAVVGSRARTPGSLSGRGEAELT